MVEEVKEILKPRTIFIENAQAQIETIEIKQEVKELSIEEQICKTFGKDCKTAIAVAKAESSLNPNAIGDTHLSKPSYGLFQISKIYHDYTVETLLNPVENIRIAKQIKDNGGFERWTTYRTGQYLKYL